MHGLGVPEEGIFILISFVHYTAAVLSRGRIFRLANRRVKLCGVEGISIFIPSSSLIKKNKKQKTIPF